MSVIRYIPLNLHHHVTVAVRDEAQRILSKDWVFRNRLGFHLGVCLDFYKVEILIFVFDLGVHHWILEVLVSKQIFVKIWKAQTAKESILFFVWEHFIKHLRFLVKVDLTVSTSHRHSCHIGDAAYVKAVILPISRMYFELGLRAKHASFEHGVFFIDGVVNRLIFSNESTSRSLPIVVEKVMEFNHWVQVLLHVLFDIDEEDGPNNNKVNDKNDVQSQ